MATRAFQPTNRTLIYRVCVVTAVIAIALAMFPFTLSAGADDIDETIATAKRNYEEARTAAKDVVVVRYREVVASFTEKKSLEVASRVQEEIGIFEKDGILLGRPEMTRAFQKYGESVKKAATNLTNAYSEAALAHAKAGNLPRADELRRELAAMNLPAKTVSLQLLRTRNYMRHPSLKGAVRQVRNDSDKLNSTYEIVNGLAESGYTSIRSSNFPNHYLVNSGLRLQLARFEERAGFRQAATFKKVKGLAVPSGVSFESLRTPGTYIRARSNGELWLDKNDSSDKFRQEATFVITEPMFDLW